MFGAVKLTKNTDPNNCSYSGYGIGFDSPSHFSYPNCDWNKNATIFGVDDNSAAHINNKKKDILVLGDGITKGLDDTIIMAKAKYSINFSRSGRKFCLSLD